MQNTIPTPPPPPPSQSQNFNLPRLDLLADNRRREFINTGVPLCKATIKGDWKTAESILQNNKDLVRYSITENYETALHVAASAESTDFMLQLVKMMSHDDLLLQTKTGDTALCLAAAAGNVKMADILVTNNNNLLTILGSEGLLPVSVAAFYGKHDMVDYLYEKANKLRGPEWKTPNKQWLLLKCVKVDLFDIALKILGDHKELLAQSESILEVLARKPSAFYESKPHMLWRIIKSIICLKVGPAAKESEAMQLLREIWTNIVERPKAAVDTILRGPGILSNGKLIYPSHILFVAAEMGNTDFVVELIRKYPDLIWKKNDDNQSIFHIAVSHRRESIYSILHEIGSMKDLITRLRDTKQNNMLHLVGNYTENNHHENISGVAFQMQHELLWFKEVKSMIPPYYREEKNKAGLTPYELFTETHKPLVVAGEKWMKDTASQSMLVATLITTVVFAVAFTIPGGYNQNNGFPMFLWDGPFMVFVIFDAISLILSSTSILVFLSILTSRYAQQDFLKSLPNKLLLGLATLFLSIMTMMVAFSVSFFVLYQKKLIPVAICISIVGIIPVISFTVLHHRLLIDVFHSARSSRLLFKPKTQLFHYQTPKF